MAKSDRDAVHSAEAPKAVGPYSQGIRSGGFLFTSGQIPLDPATGKLVPGGIDEQTRRVMENLRAVLTAGGASFDDVVKTTIYLTSMADFAAVNAIYATYFGATPPARSTVQVAALPLGASVEIDLVARTS
ncbi:MAG TPA: RidA family protein [Polyangiaceae bacterium]|jgi:2-iminobutanoate/2-iminopropanoate deaminase|nr:RidA family protein [Polyangiaceae bacterium]